jgi:hypothetical protein
MGASIAAARAPRTFGPDLHDAFTAAGYDWVTSHVFRKTVTTLMDQSELSARAAADNSATPTRHDD